MSAAGRNRVPRFKGSLIAFAGTGSPDAKQLKWPLWSVADERYVLLGDEVSTAKIQTKRMNWLAAHPPAAPAQSPGAPWLA
jgi:para-nitrobenzyl esterase